MKLSELQHEQLSERGITRDRIKEQLRRFEIGFPGVRLLRAACPEDGITRLDLSTYVKLYEQRSEGTEQIKFVPASGAASRMFKFLHKFLSEFNPSKDRLETYCLNNNKMDTFVSKIESFPFFRQVVESLPENVDRDSEEFIYHFVQHMLSAEGLGFSDMPKGLVPFHNYHGRPATAFEEHFYEAANQFSEYQEPLRLHFTVSPKHEKLFRDEIEEILDRVQNNTGRSFDISFSHQKPYTDTIAVDKKRGDLVSMADGRLLFRPAGHGALLENLNDIDADLIFIKNVDNVSNRRYLKENIDYKKMLGGITLELRDEVFAFAKAIKDSSADLKAIENFLTDRLCTVFDDDYHSMSISEKPAHLLNILERPLRVCGMVRNEGEPGGGPFWVKNQRGETSVEIVEAVQVDTDDEHQQQIAKSGTHFNPVDIVCSVRNHDGEKFDLTKFSDPDTGIITEKYLEDRPIRAQELPGLWNGGMAYWNTVFVEVPIETFNPVKTVNDLLRSAHQG